MKKIFVFIFCIFLFSSCAVTTYYTKGDISLYDYNGNLMREWNNAVLESEEVFMGQSQNKTYAIKQGGFLNFSDNNGNYLIGGGIIIVENIGEINNDDTFNNRNESISIVWNMNLNQKYKSIKQEIVKLQKKQKKYNENSSEYIDIEKQINSLIEEKLKIEEYFKEKYYNKF